MTYLSILRFYFLALVDVNFATSNIFLNHSSCIKKGRQRRIFLKELNLYSIK